MIENEPSHSFESVHGSFKNEPNVIILLQLTRAKTLNAEHPVLLTEHVWCGSVTRDVMYVI